MFLFDWQKLFMWIVALLWGAAVAGSSGCRLMTAEEIGLSKPVNRIKASKNIFGASFLVEAAQNTKHLMKVKSATFNEHTGAWDIQGLDSDYQGDAAVVMKANADQLEKLGPIVDGYARMYEARGRAIAMGLQAGGDMGKKIISAFTEPFLGASLDMDGPLGKGGIKLGGGAAASPPPAPSLGPQLSVDDLKKMIGDIVKEAVKEQLPPKKPVTSQPAPPDDPLPPQTALDPPSLDPNRYSLALR